MASYWLAALAALAFSTPAPASGKCPVEVRAADSGRGLEIDGSNCSSDLKSFWQQVQERVPADRTKLKWISLIGPVGADNVAALSSAWGSACKVRHGQGAEFLRFYSTTDASRILSPSLAALDPVPNSVDNFYVISAKLPMSTISITAPGCKLVLLTPVIYYRLRSPRNSFKVTPAGTPQLNR